MTQLEMFPEPESPVRPVRPAPGPGTPRYARVSRGVKAKPRCDDCVRVQMIDRSAGAAHVASWVRTENGRKVYLCYEHVEAWRVADKVAN